MKKDKLFLILGIVSVSIGGAMFIAGAILTLMGNAKLGDLIMGLSSLFGAAALVFMILRLSMMAKNPEAYPEYKPQEPKVIVKVVDVKEVQKSKEQELYEQYEDLYNRNLITKEELDAKRKDLLGK
ncbi:MAG: hypothetical protein IKP50_06510 [Bacilli bacterium]|nr:hypothetical protein [Bacilli bacterium]